MLISNLNTEDGLMIAYMIHNTKRVQSRNSIKVFKNVFVFEQNQN